MTVSTTASRVTYTGNGVTVLWSYNFIVPDANSMKVTLIEVNETLGNIMTVLNPALYQITGLNNPSGGTVKYPISGDGISSDYQLRIEREVAYTQETEITNQDNFNADTVEGGLDRVTMQVQQLKTVTDQVGDIEGYVSQAAAAAAAAQEGAGITGVPFIGSTIGGTANAQVVGVTSPVGYIAQYGARLSYVAEATNTGAATVAIGAGDAYDVYRMTPEGPLPLIGREIKEGNVVDLFFDGVRHLLLSAAPARPYPIGTSFEFTGPDTAIPPGFLLENGQAVSRTTYAEYFALVGETYGAGNGTTTFNVRDKRERVSAGVGDTGRLDSFDTLGATQGAKEITLTTNQIPSHRHQEFAAVEGNNTSPSADESPAFQESGFGGDKNYQIASGGATDSTIGRTSAVGGGLAHANVQPTIAANFIVYVGV